MASSLDAQQNGGPKIFSNEIRTHRTLWGTEMRNGFEANPLIVLSSATICHAATPPPPSPLWVHPTHRLQSINRRLPFHFFPSNSSFLLRNSAVNRRVKWSLDDVFVHWHTHIPLPPLFNGRWPSRMAIIPFLLEIYSNKLQEKSSFLWKNAKKSGKMAKVFRKFVLIF